MQFFYSANVDVNVLILLQSVALIFLIHQMGESVREVTDQEIELLTFATATMSLLVHHQELVRMMAHGLEMPQLVDV